MCYAYLCVETATRLSLCQKYHYLNTPSVTLFMASHPVVRDLKSLQMKYSLEENLRLCRLASVVMESE